MKRNIFNVKGQGELSMTRQKLATKSSTATTPASEGFARNYLAYLLARASFIVSNEFHAALKTWEMSVPEWRVLACLTDIEGLSVGELAAMALMKQPRLTKVLDRMERDGLLKRRGTAKDRRRVTLHLTAKGRTRVKPVQRAASRHEAELLSQFTDDEKLTIKSALDLLIGRGRME
jgi:3-hydroxy-9,10-secoandrosta-1,3,5(10)-triene-9,17-dione monooxygenase reductase component